MKFKEIISDLSEEKQKQFKKWYGKDLTITLIWACCVSITSFIVGFILK